MAGRPGAARAAGRATAACPDGKTPCHRVVPSDGRARDRDQLRRLRLEGARPRARESLADWARRVEARFVGNYRTHQFVPRKDAVSVGWNPEGVEAFQRESAATARGFTLVGSPERRREPLPRARDVTPEPALRPVSERCEPSDWSAVKEAIEHDGAYRWSSLLAPSECAAILNESIDPARFERSIEMLPRGYGIGSYHYYREPLPQPAGELRARLYRALAPPGYPETLEEFWARCRTHGQTRASSILIGYGEGGVNHPHRDVYGPVAFPFQAVVVLSKRGRDFSGGEFYVTDEDGSGYRRSFAVSEGDVVIFATRNRRRGRRRVPLRHGMTPVTRGRRYALGIVFHLAE